MVSGELGRAIVFYEAGWQGDNAALLETIELLEQLRRGGRDREVVVQAYYGGALVARARLVPDRQKRRWLQRGAAELDAAVRAAPEDVQVRFLRARTLAILPRLAGKTELVWEDLEWLVERAESGERRSESGVGSLAANCRQTIFYQAGSFALRNRDPRAMGWFQAAVEIGEEGGIEMERLQRMLQLAREQFSSKDERTYD